MPAADASLRRSPIPAGNRGPLDAARLTAAVAAVGLDLTVIREIDSTNAALARIARGETSDPALAGLARQWRASPAPEDAPRGRGLALAAERQTAGRGRLDRSWVSRPGAGLTVSLLIQPRIAISRLGWLPMVVGMSLVSTVRAIAGVPAVLKWPNDVLVEGGKLAGILVEVVPVPASAPSVVIGFGLNVNAEPDELPDRSTSLLLAGADPAALDRTELLERILVGLVGALAAWEADPQAVRVAYLAMCATIGREVRVELPDGSADTGRATDVDPAGRLVVAGRAYSAGDVVHLR
ncbi:biotin--[acetyl-CoA-carboxylase] ligase [Frankia sp. AiPs1]|uniref:biotin--[acetyl-CoA-carboxylase] ligase n=1 Tax=Frankia sp. AiPs1 TaxID=573493 RepID=UPI0020440D78|nr:biotin--[acetyl-CoA-carboxylase] ligase [Frankia sp. AiPs1]MCM3920881.1 biotin--[acetyl-CoA-carboxylase] ligase [Frankia sp. AiPs1]